MTGISLNLGNESLSPLALFLHADIVVKAVMIGLLLASLWTWTIIIGRGLKLAKVSRIAKKYETDFWAAEDIDRFHRERGGDPIPTAKVLTAGVEEWRRSTRGNKVDRDATRARLGAAMSTTAAAEIDTLADRLNILATIGSVCPFVGLFGTVWGIMRSFSDIAASQNTSFGAVAPGIAEALFATALGLFAAIPAVIAYNRMTWRLDRIEAALNRFADKFHTTLSRELDEG